MKRLFLTAGLALMMPLGAADLIQGGALNVKLAEPKRVETVPMGSYLGTYTYPPAHRYTISANVDGFVTEIAVRAHTAVTKSQKLFTIKSPKLLDLQSDYIATLLELQYYQKEIDRLEPLAEKGVVASKRYLESKNQFEKLRSSAAFKRDVLLAYGLSAAQLDTIAKTHKPNPVLTITSPANASIAELAVEAGSFVSQGATLAKLVDTTECHLEVDMPWQLAATLKPDETLYSDDSSFHIFAMSPQIDSVSQTRGIDLHETKPCNDRGGASVNVTFYRKQRAWKVPSSAIVGLEHGHALFVAAKGGYRMVPVTVIAQLEGLSFIEAPLQPGESVAVSSVLALKSAAEGSSE